MKRSFYSNYLDIYNMTPDHLRSVADIMENDGIEYIELSPEEDRYSGLSIEETSHRKETPEEIRQRKELIEKVKQREKLDKKQRAINKKIFQIESVLELKAEISEPPVKTLTTDVYWVYKGCKVGDWVSPKNGFIKIYKDKNQYTFGPISKKEKDA